MLEWAAESSTVERLPLYSRAASVASRPRMPFPRVSVVVPTFRRPVLLQRCLHALVKQSFPHGEFEIIVVDDDIDTRSRRVVETVAARCDGAPAVHYLAATDTQGPAAARNLGWRFARGAVIAFLDDDTVPARDWLQHGLAAMMPNVAAVAGRVMVPNDRRPEDDASRPGADHDACEFAGSNCFVQRRALVGIGGFDERFTAPGREDSDLHFRLMARFDGETRIVREMRALVLHPVRNTGWNASLRQQRRKQFDALLFKKHPELYRQRIHAAPRYDYYAIVLMLVTTLLSGVAGPHALTTAAFLLWLALTSRVAAQRLAGPSHQPAQLLEALVTSLAVPPMAVFWRLVGMVRYNGLAI